MWMPRHPIMLKFSAIQKKCSLFLLFVSLVALPFMHNKVIVPTDKAAHEAIITASLTGSQYIQPLEQTKNGPPRRVAPMRRFQKQRPQSMPTHGIKIDRSREQIIRREDRRPSVADAYWNLIREQPV